MSITAKSMAALLAVFLALFAGAWAILESAVRPRFEQLELAAHTRDLTRLEENLAAIANDMTARAGDYAHWDDAYAFVGERDRGFIAANFSDQWLEQYGADFVLFATSEGRVLWSRGRTAAGAFVTNPVLSAQFITEPTPADGAPVHGIVWSPEGPVLYGAARATRSDGSGPARGLVVIARRLDTDVLRQQLQLNVRFINGGDVSRNYGDHFTQLLRSERVSWSTHDRLLALIPLLDGQRLVGAVLAEQPRDLSALGDRAIGVTLLLFALMFAGAVAALWLLYKRVVISRLARIRDHFQTQAGHAAPIPSDGTRDEIGQLTQAYNALALRLRDAVESEQRALLEHENAAAANRMKSDFLANVSHELRTPLNAVIGYAELIAEDLEDAGVASAHEDLQRITGSARHLLGLINEILDLSRIEGDRLDLRPEAFRVDEMLASVVESITPVAQAEGNVLLLEFGADLGVAYNDQLRLRQSLMNVLAHACKRVHGSAVRLRAERSAGANGPELRFMITDAGPPLGRAQMDSLFDLFLRSSETPLASPRLGLAVTRKLLGLMGGGIEARNDPGGGCTFIVTAPVESRDAGPSVQSAA